jgi:hypothetical protein
MALGFSSFSSLTNNCMEYLILIAATLVGYPVFLLAAYLLSKVIFVKDEEFDEFDAKQRLQVKHREHTRNHRRNLAHA